MEFLAHNMGTSTFAEYAGVTVETVKDWRKRDMIPLGQPNPNGNGRWLYSRQDAMAVHIAGLMLPSGVEWASAIDMGRTIAGHLVGRALYGDDFYGQRFLSFPKVNKGVPPLMGIAGPDLGAAFDGPLVPAGEFIVHAVDVDAIEHDLPQKYLDGLRSLRATA